MKPVLIAFGALLAIMLLYVWANGKYGNKAVSNQVRGEKQIFFDPEVRIGVGKEQSFEVKANYLGGKVVGYNLEFQYDPAIVKIISVEPNGEIFDQKVVAEAEDYYGKITIEAKTSRDGESLTSGVQTLATIKMSGLKKGGMIISGGRRSEVAVWEAGKVSEGDFQFPGFKVTVQ